MYSLRLFLMIRARLQNGTWYAGTIIMMRLKKLHWEFTISHLKLKCDF